MTQIPDTVRMTDTEWFQLVVAATAVLSLLGLLYRYVVRPVAVIVHRAGEFFEDWNGTPARPGRPARPGAMHRLAQLEHNGGTSVKDLVEQTRAGVEHLRAELGSVHETQRRHGQTIERLRQYHADEEALLADIAHREEEKCQYGISSEAPRKPH